MGAKAIGTGLMMMVLVGTAGMGDRVLAQALQTQASNDTPTSQVQQLLALGKQQYRRAEFRAAIATYQQVLKLTTQLKDSDFELEALTYLADIDLWNRQYSSAENKIQRALQLSQQVKNRVREAESLAGLSALHRVKGDYAKALDYAQKAIEWVEKVGDRRVEARSRFMLGIALYHQAEYTKALDVLQEAIKLAQADQNKDEVSYLLNWISLTQSALKDNNSALLTIQEQQKLSKESGCVLAEYGGLWVVASISQQQPDQVLLAYQKALTIAQLADNSWFQIATAQEIGWIYVNQKETAKALELYQKALVVAGTIDDAAVADIQNRTGIAYYRAGKYQQALEFFQQSLIIYQKTTNQAEIAKILINVGDAHRELKQYPQSVEAFQQSLSIYTALQNYNLAGDSQNRIGMVYYSTKKHADALNAYNNSVTFYKKSQNKIDEAYTLRRIARTFHQLENDKSAIKYYLLALEIFEQEKVKLTGDSHRYASALTLWELGNRYFDQKSYESALEVYQKSLAAYQGSLSDEADVLQNMGNTYHRLKKYSLALESYEKARIGFQKSANPINEAYSLRNIARIYHQIKDEKSTIEFYLQALELFKKEDSKFKGKLDQYADALILWELGNRYFDQKQYEKALEIYQRSLNAYQGSTQDEADVLRHISNTYNQLNKLEMASKTYQQALEKAQQYVEVQSKTLGNSEQQLTKEELSGNRIQQSIDFEGIWQVLPGQSLGGMSYSGVTRIAKLKNTYKFFWNLSTGTRSGIALLENGKFFVGWGEGEERYGVVAYKIGREGSLWGKWANDSGQVGTELLTGGKPGQLEGKYQLKGTNYNGGEYGGTVELRKTGDTYQIFWDNGVEYRGVAFLSGDYLVVGWGKTGNPGAAIYEIKDGRAVGQLTLFSSSKIMTENLIKNEIKNNESIDVIRLENEAENLFNVGQFQSSINKLQKALKIAKNGSDYNRQANILKSMGVLYLEKEQFKQALALFNQSLEINNLASNNGFRATILNHIGIAHLRQGQYVKSLQVLQQALEIRENLHSSNDIGIVSTNIGLVYTKQGKYADALALYEKALEIAGKAEDRSTRGRILDKMGASYAEQGKYSLALKTYEEALINFRKGGIASSTRGITLKNIGLVHASKGQYEKALFSYEESLTSHRFALNRNRAEEASTVSCQGLLASYLGQYSKSLELYQSALSIYRELGYRASEGEMLSLIGDSYASQKDFKKALEFYQQALLIHDEVGNLPSKITTLSDMGKTYSVINDSRTLTTHQMALKIARQVDSRPRTSQVLNNFAQAQIQLGQFTEAQSSLQEAIAIAREIGNTPIEAQALSNLAALQTKQSQPALAIVLYKQSVIQYENIRKGLAPLPKDQQESYTKTVAQTYRNLAELLIQQNRLLEAQQILDLLKLQEIKDYTPPSRNAVQQAELQLTETEQTIAKQYNSLISFRQQLNQCKGKLNDTNCDKLRQVELQQSKALIQFMDQLAKVSDRCKNAESCTLPGNSSTAAANEMIRKQPGSIVILPVVLEKTMWILVIAENGIITRYETKVDRLTLGKKVLELRQLLQNPNSDLTQLQTTSKQLYDWLIRPIEPTIKASKHPPKLIFALDRVTRYIPMGVLYDGQTYRSEERRVGKEC